MEHPRITDIERDYIVNNVEYDASKRVIGHFVDVCFMVKPGNMLSLALCFVGIQWCHINDDIRLKNAPI